MEEYNDRFSQRHVVIFSLFIGFIFVTIFGFGFFTILASILMPQFMLAIPSIEYFLSSINNFIAFIFLILIIKKIGLFDNIPWNFSGVSKGLLIGFTLILFTILQMLLIFISAPDKTIVLGLIPMINTIIYCISIALWEETLCRGLLLTNMLKKWGDTKKGMIISIVLSSVIFGGFHIISAVNGNLEGALIQVMYASIMGIMLAVIYLKTKSLWSAIVLHIILNFAAYSMPYLMPYSAGINPVFFIIMLILFNALWLIISYFILLKTDVSEVKELLSFNK